MTVTYHTFPDKLRQHVAGFSVVCDEHLRDYDEVLPHVLLGDLVRFVTERIHTDGAASQPVRAALDLLEQGIQAEDEKLQEAISVSFLENLDPEDEAFAKLESLMGPGLRNQLQNYK